MKKKSKKPKNKSCDIYVKCSDSDEDILTAIEMRGGEIWVKVNQKYVKKKK